MTRDPDLSGCVLVGWFSVGGETRTNGHLGVVLWEGDGLGAAAEAVEAVYDKYTQPRIGL